jgi:DNA uptake protein ComE-like DNA-binding protein
MAARETAESWIPPGYEPRTGGAEEGNGVAQAEEEWAPPKAEPAPAETQAGRRPGRSADPPAAKAKPERRQRRAPSARDGGDDRLDLNALGFEDLRALRLSITQSNRLLKQREQRGGFRSLDDLDGVPGFPRDVIAELKRRCRV